MKILNVMLAAGLGGIEQAFLDYGDALALAGHEVYAVIHPKALVRAMLETRNIEYYPVSNLGAWDPGAMAQLWLLLRKLKPDAVIAHGNRAVTLLARAGAKPLIAAAHNYKIHYDGVAAVFAPTQDLLRHVAAQGVPKERIFIVPNMVRVPAQKPPRQWSTPPVIGAMGRFVVKKGFDVYIEALAQLREQGVSFSAILAGDGEEAEPLSRLAATRGLTGTLAMPGWQENTRAFFDGIDIFCLPSHHEPFGIVLLEAMAQALPVISTTSEGPSEILQSGINGVLVPRDEPGIMAESLKALIADPKHAGLLGQNAYDTARKHYDIGVASAKLDLAVRAAQRL